MQQAEEAPLDEPISEDVEKNPIMEVEEEAKNCETEEMSDCKLLDSWIGDM